MYNRFAFSHSAAYGVRAGKRVIFENSILRTGKKEFIFLYGDIAIV